MADPDPPAPEPAQARINPNEDEALRAWAARFGVSPERLREAVLLVGDHADEVERYLRDGTR